MPTPKIGRFSSTHQPPRTPSQPVNPDTRDRQEVEADLDRDRAEAGDEYQPKHLDLSPEEIAAEEREKADLAALLRETRPAKPGPERSAPETLSSHDIVDLSEVAPPREVEVIDTAALEAVAATEEAESELLALAQDEAAILDAEVRAFEEQTATEMARLKKAHEAKLAEIRARQEAARQKIARERAAAAPAELAARAKTATREAEANRTRTDSTLDAQRAQLAEEWAPLLTAAKKAVRDVAQIDKQAGPALRELASMAAFIDTPSSWPVELRKKMGAQCIMPARELVKLLDSYQRTDQQDCPRDTIAQVESMLQTWRPGTPVATLRQLLTYINADTPRYLRAEIEEINRRFEIIEAQGLEYIRSGEVPPEVVISEATEAIRREGRDAHLFKNLRFTHPTHASGMGDPL